MKLTIKYDKLTLETRLNTYSIDRAPLESDDAWYDFAEFAVLNLWCDDGEYKAAVYPVTDAGDVMHEYGTSVDIVMVEEPIRRVVIEHKVKQIGKSANKFPARIIPAEAFGGDFDKYEGLTLRHEEGQRDGVWVSYSQTYLYTRKNDEQLLREFN